jgi:Ca2+-transporting ATPase
MEYNGLSTPEARQRRSQYGPNILSLEKAVPAIKILISQIANPLTAIIFLVGLISFLRQEYGDLILIFLVVAINASLGFFQEYKAQRTLVFLKSFLRPKAKVWRDAKQQEIEATELVPGDVVFLEAGDKVPADGLVVQSSFLFVNEAILTGESESLVKVPEDPVFMGTEVYSGRGVISITAIGSKTEVGIIAQSLKKTRQPLTPLQYRLTKLGRQLIYLVFCLCGLVLVLGLAVGRDFWPTFKVATILAVAIIPEALPMAVTFILSVGMQKILKKKAVVRKLLAVETLGSVTTICLDKTGTLTEGKLRVVETDFTERERSRQIIRFCVNPSDGLDIALQDWLGSKNDSKGEAFESLPRISEIPFDSHYKFMAVVNGPDSGGNYLLFAKGAPEIILEMSGLSQEAKGLALSKIEQWGKRGLKVLGLGWQEGSLESLEKISVRAMPQLKWAGLVGFLDPPRPEVEKSILAAHQAGIRVKVVTGDHRHTAQKVMDSLGFSVRDDEILDGAELENMDEEELKGKVADISLFARVTPLQKLRIVGALQERGEVVAMTGDGFNDAPALKKANIGIVVEGASEAAREIADIILLDSNFQTIVFAVEEGRAIFENIKKAIFYMLSNSFAEVVMILGSIILNWPLPLTVAQILWLHFLCDGPEDIVLGLEAKEKGIMAEGPKKIEASFLDKHHLFLIFFVSVFSGLSSLVLFGYFGLLKENLELGRALAFISVSFTSPIFIFACRSLRRPFWRYENFWSNKWLFAAVFSSLFLQFGITYIPVTQKILQVKPLEAPYWLLMLLIAVVITLTVEMMKMKLGRETVKAEKGAVNL